MKIDFDLIPEEIVPNFKGGDKFLSVKSFSDGLNKMMKAKLVPGASIGMHTHETNSEILYVLSGEGTLSYEGQVILLQPGDVHYCPKSHSHSIKNNGQIDFCFFAVVPEQ